MLVFAVVEVYLLMDCSPMQEFHNSDDIESMINIMYEVLDGAQNV